MKRKLTVGDVLCGYCRVLGYKKFKLETDDFSAKDRSSSSDEDISFSENLNRTKSSRASVELPIQRTVSTHAYCFICGSQKDHVVSPLEARLQKDDVAHIRVHSYTTVFEERELKVFMESLSTKINKTFIDIIGDCSLPDDQIKIFTGLSWENIIHLRSMLSSMRSSPSRNVIQALVVSLFKLRTGNSNNKIAAILELENAQVVSNYVSSVLSSFEKDVLLQYFGYRALNRSDLVQLHTTTVIKKLFDLPDDCLVLICDGTYIRHEKSKNNKFQRRSFSGQKKVPLVKPFTICTTDGFIVDMMGPYMANMNDADIMKFIMDDPNGFKTLLKKGDVFVLDRGFRDVKIFLESERYKVLMPALKGFKEVRRRFRKPVEEEPFKGEVGKGPGSCPKGPRADRRRPRAVSQKIGDNYGLNRRNDRWLAYDLEDVPVVARTKFPASVHILSVVSSEGDVMPPHFLNKGETVTKEVYLRVLTTLVKPWMDTVASGKPYIFQQDGAPAHTSHLVQNWLSDNVDMFWSKEFWPPNSPDLNPLNYYVWSVIERVTNKLRHPNVASLQAAIEAAFLNMDKPALQNACNRFRPRIEAVIAADGGYIE
ncbi:transposable element tcb1 transposase [Lasius niger]|uniref:Transposable element tcb1 transposase n=1 Tax=Lasius niger TaxID=67767 RepID=A0A0J7KCQ2_LASNI|nr:transposable element tcb1 transposase [Lasius niger]